MRYLFLILFILLTDPALAALGILKGQDLVKQCSAELDLMPTSQMQANDGGTLSVPAFRCRNFLQDYIRVTLAPNEALGLSKDIYSLTQKVCLRLPDFISYHDLAKILIDYAANNQNLLNGPADHLAEAALIDHFPCSKP
jgi:hypothetical protein